jgi:hypothetical protein
VIIGIPTVENAAIPGIQYDRTYDQVSNHNGYPSYSLADALACAESARVPLARDPAAYGNTAPRAFEPIRRSQELPNKSVSEVSLKEGTDDQNGRGQR